MEDWRALPDPPPVIICRNDPRWPADNKESPELGSDLFNPDRFLTSTGSAQGSQLIFGAGVKYT